MLEDFVAEDAKYIIDQDKGPTNRYEEVVGEHEGDVQRNQGTSKQEHKSTLSKKEAQAENISSIEFVSDEVKDETRPSSE